MKNIFNFQRKGCYRNGVTINIEISECINKDYEKRYNYMGKRWVW